MHSEITNIYLCNSAKYKVVSQSHGALGSHTCVLTKKLYIPK